MKQTIGVLLAWIGAVLVLLVSFGAPRVAEHPNWLVCLLLGFALGAIGVWLVWREES